MTGENKKEQELKPCPFCGSGDVGLPFNDGRSNRWMTCFQCGCDGPIIYAPENDPTEIWNKRVVSEADSVSRTKPAESASVIPQSPAKKEIILTPLNGSWITRCCACGKEYENGAGSTRYRHVADAHNTTVTALSARASEAERKASRIERFSNQLYTELREGRPLSNKGTGIVEEVQHLLNSVESLRSSLLQHESVIEKMRAGLSDICEEQFTLQIHARAHGLLALQPTDSVLDAWFQEKVQPLVEALEKARQEIINPYIRRDYDIVQIIDAALAQPKPETKL